MLYIAGILLFLILMTSSRLKELLLTNLLSIVLFRFVVWRKVWSVVFNELSKLAREALNLGFICRTQTRYIQYFDEGMDRSFVSAVLARNLCSFVQTLQAKNKLTNEIDIKCITWGMTNLRMLDGKADGC